MAGKLGLLSNLLLAASSVTFLTVVSVWASAKLLGVPNRPKLRDFFQKIGKQIDRQFKKAIFWLRGCPEPPILNETVMDLPSSTIELVSEGVKRYIWGAPLPSEHPICLLHTMEYALPGDGTIKRCLSAKPSREGYTELAMYLHVMGFDKPDVRRLLTLRADCSPYIRTHIFETLVGLFWLAPGKLVDTDEKKVRWASSLTSFDPRERNSPSGMALKVDEKFARAFVRGESNMPPYIGKEPMHFKGVRLFISLVRKMTPLHDFTWEVNAIIRSVLLCEEAVDFKLKEAGLRNIHAKLT